jgi:short-subunit dehydrogenase
MPTRTGKTVLITGASVGIGRDLAHLFAQDGHDVILVSRNRSHLDGLAETLRQQYQIQATVLPADLSIPNIAAEIFQQVRAQNVPVEFLVNNAGFGAFGPFADSDLMTQLNMIQVNVSALVQLTRLCLPPMLERHSGRIMNVASTAAFVPGPYMSIYYATKAFVLSFSEAVDAEISGTGVTITTVCPGVTETEFHKRAGVGRPPGLLGRPMTSMDVAKIGYRAMLRGKRTVITGVGNKLMITATKFAPRSLTAALAKGVNKNR